MKIKDLLLQTESSKQSKHRYGFIYDMLFGMLAFEKEEGLNVLEIGVSVYGNGSLDAWSRSELVKRAVGIDKRPYAADLNEKAVFYQMDAYSEETVNELLEVEGSIFDVIIHDGIAEVAPQKFFMEHYEALLSENGFLVCEDVSALGFVNRYADDDSVFIIDGWANRGDKIRSYNNDKRFYTHIERVLIKSKTEKIKDVKVHEYKKHIIQLPDNTVFPETKRDSTELAISVPLFHSDLDTQYKPFDVKRFQDVHCKGAVWAGMSMIHNSDLGDRGTPLYFHIEDKAWEYALPVFEKFGIPEAWLRKITVPEATLDYKVDKAKFGKTFLSLLDDELDPDVLLVVDSDFFTLSTGPKLRLYDKLTSTLLKTQPAMTHFRLIKKEYWWWVGLYLLASGLPSGLINQGDLNDLEVKAFKRLGFDKQLTETHNRKDKVQRFFAENYMQTFPRGHAIRDWTIDKMKTCYTAPYLHAMWAEFNQPFIELSKILDFPIYDWEHDFIECKHGYNCFAHIRVHSEEKRSLPSKVSQYWDNFFEHITRHIQGGEKQ